MRTYDVVYRSEDEDYEVIFKDTFDDCYYVFQSHVDDKDKAKLIADSLNRISHA